MEQRILTIWIKASNSYCIWDIYPAGRKGLESVKREVANLEKRGIAGVIVGYDELSEETGRRHIDTIYETGKDLSDVWKDLWEEKLEEE